MVIVFFSFLVYNLGMELQWGFLLPDGEILEGSGVSEFPDHRFLASEYFTAQGDPDTGDPESVALTAGWIAYVIDSGEFRLKLSRLPGEDSAWPLNNAISAVERLRERYGVEPVIVTVHMFTAAGLARGESPDEPMRMANPYETWGFVNMDINSPNYNKIIDLRKRGISEEKLAAKMVKGDPGGDPVKKLLQAGWIKYWVSVLSSGTDLRLKVDFMPGEEDDFPFRSRIARSIERIQEYAKIKEAHITVELPYGFAFGRNVDEVWSSLIREHYYHLRKTSKNPRRVKNDKYWTSGDQIISWGFVHPYENKPVDGRTVRGVKSHDELAVKFTRTRSIQKAFRKLKEEGWIRYIVYDDGGLLEVSVEAYDMPGEAQEEMADRIMTCIRRIINHVGMDPYRFIVDSRHGHVVGYTMSEVRRKLEELLQPVF